MSKAKMNIENDTPAEHQVIEALKKRNISCHIFDESDQMFNYLMEEISGKSVGVGDSMTFEEVGLYDFLRVHSGVFLDKYDKKMSKVDKQDLYRKNFSADVFLSGINAISLSGKIYNLDGNGSRVAPIIYGPSRVFLICGTNKICASDDAAVLRVRQYAAPKDAVRLNKKTPCAVTGKCVDCRSEDRICNYMTIIEGQFNPNRIEVILLRGNYGY